MSKKSVFKFNISNMQEKKEIIDTIIGNYLSENGFDYNSNENCYIIGTVSEAEADKNMAINVATTLGRQAAGLDPTGGAHLSTLYTNIHQCLEYEIVGNELVIKAYTLNAFSNIKAYIHSNVNTNMAGKEYYNHLQKELFSKLKEKNIILENIEVEKVTDGSGSKLFKKTLLFTLPVIIVFAIITIIAYCSSH